MTKCDAISNDVNVMVPGGTRTRAVLLRMYGNSNRVAVHWLTKNKEYHGISRGSGQAGGDEAVTPDLGTTKQNAEGVKRTEENNSARNPKR